MWYKKLPFREFFEVIGYTGNADVYCPACAQEIWGNPDNAIDSEGNKVHPVFLGDEWDYTPVCGACLEELDTGSTPQTGT